MSMTAEEFAAQFAQKMGMLSNGTQVEQAAAKVNPNKEDGAVTPGEIRAKGLQDGKQAAIGNFADDNKLASNLEQLQRVSKDFRGLGWDKSEVVQNPTNVIRAKKADGSYVIPNWKLNQMICTLLAEGSYKERSAKGQQPAGTF